jgi:hypothetical protein
MSTDDEFRACVGPPCTLEHDHELHWPDAQVERLSATLHAIYQEEARRQAGTGEDTVRHPDDYDALPEHTKEYDRVLARFIIERETWLVARIAALKTELAIRGSATSQASLRLMSEYIDELEALLRRAVTLTQHVDYSGLGQRTEADQWRADTRAALGEIP